MSLNIKDIKKDFPIFKHHPDLVYLDSTATTLRPKAVIKAVRDYYEKYSANVHRGIYEISEKATFEYESARETVGRFINAPSGEIIFVRNTTEAINLVAYTLGREIISKGDEIITTIAEHHSNFVPWQQLAFENGADFKVLQALPEDNYVIKSKHVSKVITPKTKLVALTYISNVFGIINPIKQIISEIKKINPAIVVLVDAAQAVPHIPIDVKALGADFIAFSGHKMCAPTGIGVLWGKSDFIDNMHPFMFGGDMIEKVQLDKTTFNKPPHKFEAGTPHIAGAIGLGAAIDYLGSLDIKKVNIYEHNLIKYAMEQLKKEFSEGIRFVGPDNSEDKIGLCSFTFFDYHPHDVAQILSDEGVSVRAGHHCAMPLHESLGLDASIRASFYIYSSEEDVKKLIKALKKVEQIFHH